MRRALTGRGLPNLLHGGPAALQGHSRHTRHPAGAAGLNDLIWPLITLADDSKRTITVGLYYFQGETQTQYGAMFAGYLIASVPLFLLFLVGMKQFMAGVTSGAIKA